MADTVTAAASIDVPADKALRLECLRLAVRDEHGVTADIVERAAAYAAFVLEYSAPGPFHG
jgi:hypothetical protein